MYIKKKFSYRVILCAVAFYLFSGGILQAEGNPSKGKEIFYGKGTCVACHNIGRGDRPTGPDLKDVHKRRSLEWLKKWIANPSAMVNSDATAKELFNKYKITMPALGLNDKEIEDVIAFIKQESEQSTQEASFVPLNKEEFAKAKQIFFDRCSGCHGAKRWGATGPSLLPNSHIKKAKEIPGGGTRSIGTYALKQILTNGSPAGMPAWGKEGILSPEEIDLMARYVQMDPPPVPSLGMKEAKKFWKLIVPLSERPKQDPTNGGFLDYMGIILRDAGKVAIVDAKSKKLVNVVDTGKAVHILRSSKSGRYFYAIGRDGRLALIDLWYKKPRVVARTRTCWDARSVDSSKYKGYEDKYAIVGCYTPNQYAIVDGQTLEPISITSVSEVKDWATNNKLPEVRVASIVASEDEPIWVINLKEPGWVFLIDYTNPKHPKETRIKADNFLHDGGWVQFPGSGDKRYFLVAANAKNRMCVVDTKEHKVFHPCIETGKIPHPGRGANIVHPKYGPVYVTGHIGEGKLSFIGVDPVNHPQYAWKVVDTLQLKSAGTLFVKSHPKSNHLWVDLPLSSLAGVNGEVGVYNIKTGALKYIKVSDKRVVHMEYNRAGDEVWISGWLDGKIYIYNDKDLKLKKVITGDWIKTPTGKFNVYNTMNDIY